MKINDITLNCLTYFGPNNSRRIEPPSRASPTPRRTGIESVGLGALAQRGLDHGLDAFYEISPQVDRPSLIETDRFIGSINHGVGRLRELRDDGIGHAGITVYVIGRAW